jgi:hypothetical protein
MPDPNEPLTKKQKAEIKRAKNVERDRSMRAKVNKDFPAYGDKKSKGYKKGGRVRGCGIARKGLSRARSR